MYIDPLPYIFSAADTNQNSETQIETEIWIHEQNWNIAKSKLERESEGGWVAAGGGGGLGHCTLMNV